MKTMRGMWLALGAGAMLMASTEAGAQSRGSGIPVQKEGPGGVRTTSSTSTASGTANYSGGEVMPAMAMLTPDMIASWRDEQISAHWITGDSLEAAISRLALSKAQSADVRSFAQQMVDDHTRTMNELKQLAAHEHFPPMPPANDPDPAMMITMYNRLRDMPAGAAWDRAFMNFQIMHHQHVVDMREPLEDKAGDNDFEDWLQAQEQPLKGHLERARSVGAMVGATGMR